MVPNLTVNLETIRGTFYWHIQVNVLCRKNNEIEVLNARINLMKQLRSI